MKLQDFERCVGFISALIGILSAVFAILAWRKARQIRLLQLKHERLRAEKIRLILVQDGNSKRHVLGYRPRRDQATRQEILGILGMYFGRDRFDSSRLVPILENGEFDLMISGETDELCFTVSATDFDQLVKRDAELGPKTPSTQQPTASDAPSEREIDE